MIYYRRETTTVEYQHTYKNHIIPIKDLLFKQSSGKQLTREEKDRVTHYAESQRKKKQNKSK